MNQTNQTSAIDLTSLPLDWELARNRLSRDIRDDFFPDPLRNEDLLFAARKDVASAIAVDHYLPCEAENWDVPKANLTLRHSINVTPADRLVYQALVDHLAAVCDQRLSERCYAFRLRNSTSHEMFRSSVAQFMACDEGVRAAMRRRANPHVVVLDVAQYFENIDLDTLHQKLVALTGARVGSATRVVVDVLSTCLSSWTPYKRYGLPQNMWPSSFLGNCFLASLDAELESSGWDFYRYMDDVKIVTDSEGQARRALRAVITHLREFGLSVNGKKTGILRPGTKEWIDLTRPPDADIERVEAAVATNDPDSIQDAARSLLDMLATAIRLGDTGRRFRFAIARLTGIRRNPKSRPVLQDSLEVSLVQLTRDNPELTPLVCEYLRAAPSDGRLNELLEHVLGSDEAYVYGWQNYHLWLLAAETELDSRRLLQRATEVLDADVEGAEAAGACVYLAAMGGEPEVGTLLAALKRLPKPHTLQRALVIGLQEQPTGVVDEILEKCGAAAYQLRTLAQYLSRHRTPKYTGRLRRVPLSRLGDDIPDLFS